MEGAFKEHFLLYRSKDYGTTNWADPAIYPVNGVEYDDVWTASWVPGFLDDFGGKELQCATFNPPWDMGVGAHIIVNKRTQVTLPEFKGFFIRSGRSL